MLEELEFIAVKVGVLFSAPNIQDGNHFGGKFNVRSIRFFRRGKMVCDVIGLLDVVFGKWREKVEASVSIAMGIRG